MAKSKKSIESEPLHVAPASELVRTEWMRRIEAEYHSCAFAHHLTLWLIQLGASPDLISAGLAIAADELAHAQLSHEVFVAAGGTNAPRLDRERLRLARDAAVPLEHDVLRTCVELFCLGETVAVPLFKELRQRATVPVARAALDRVLVDEVRHRDFGWTLLDWLLSTEHAPTLRQLIDAELPQMFSRLCESYGQQAVPELEVPVADRTWGLMPSSIYDSVLRRTHQRDFTPRFSRREIICPSLPL